MERYLVKFVDRVKSGCGVLDEISSEYDTVRAQTKQSRGSTTEAGSLSVNIKKNRYKDILPYDHTRVILEPLENPSESDYINASFIQGVAGKKRYIATQGPLPHTLLDFWRMVWLCDVKVIMMACKEIELGKRKCERYWVGQSETACFGPFLISNLEEFSPSEETVVRILQVKYQDESRTLSQFQYTAWPDHGIPGTSCGILGMMDMVRRVQGTDTAPILIHCSAGCGRTGVICAVDYVHDLLLTQGISEDFSIMEIVKAMRKQRPSAVQTKEQYQFLYHTVAQMFQKYLQTPNLAEIRLHLYDNVELVNRQHQTQSHRASNVQPSRSDLQEQKMNDTYAVVNKPKQRPAGDSAPLSAPLSPAIHHYDNAGLGTLSCPTTALYSAVKPKNKNHAGGVPAQSVSSDRALLPNPRRAERSPAADPGDYEPLPGISSASRTEKDSDTQLMRKSSEEFTSTDDDYEYVSNPIRNKAGYCSPGSMEFNCRIRKPKGPRDPPAEWSRMER